MQAKDTVPAWSPKPSEAKRPDLRIPQRAMRNFGRRGDQAAWLPALRGPRYHLKIWHPQSLFATDLFRPTGARSLMRRWAAWTPSAWPLLMITSLTSAPSFVGRSRRRARWVRGFMAPESAVNNSSSAHREPNRVPVCWMRRMLPVFILPPLGIQPERLAHRYQWSDPSCSFISFLAGYRVASAIRPEQTIGATRRSVPISLSTP